MKWKRIIGISLAIATLVALACPLSAYAIIEPDTAATINAVYVYDGGLLEDGDVGVLIDYYLDYAALPTETATEAWLAIFMDTDGTTQLKSAVPYSYNDKGYGRGLIWIYFTEAEATAASLDSVDIALYSVRLCGNPTLSWTDNILNPITPPITTGTIDQWNTTGSMSTLLGLRVLYYAGILEAVWADNLVEMTAVGNRLTSTSGIEYFENTIGSLRTMCPQVFSNSTVDPDKDDIDYETSFGAVLTSAVVAGSPITLVSGANAEVATGAGTVTLVLNEGTSGTVTGAVVGGAPVTIVAGTNTVTITGAGAFTVTVALSDTTTGLDGSVIGTGWDLTALATLFGLSRWMFSGVVWFLLSAIICGYAVSKDPGRIGEGSNATRLIFGLFLLCSIGGILLGLLKPVVGAVIMIGVAGFFVGYVLLFRNSSA